MATPVEHPVYIENEGKDNELHYHLVYVVDMVSRQNNYGLDVYNSHNELIERVGYTYGEVIVSPGVVSFGDTLNIRTPKERKLIEKVLNHQVTEEVVVIQEEVVETQEITQTEENEVQGEE